MKILGIKFTHDGAIALIDKGKLIFSYEMEKLNNFPRHSPFRITVEEVEKILSQYGYSLSTIDQIAIDGWSAMDLETFVEQGEDEKPMLKFDFLGKEIVITTKKIAAYGHFVKEDENILQPWHFSFAEQGLSYNSYLHVAGHVASAYCTSPFSSDKDSSFVLVWDGAMPPQVFYYNYKKNTVENLGILFPLLGNIYINFAHAFKPFSEMKKSLSIAGKAMAYMAIGKVNEQILKQYNHIFADLIDGFDELVSGIEQVNTITTAFVDNARQFATEQNLPDPDMLTTFQEFIRLLIIEKLSALFDKYPNHSPNLCITGGCGLNIKWNSSIRNIQIIKHVWVPPFPNDCGNAIGAACCEMLKSTESRSLEWKVYTGPPIKDGIDNSETNSVFAKDFISFDCNIEELAGILFKYNEPVVFLRGHAELGPRALGNRSILAPAHSREMKQRLNEMKNREHYRPVAPICLEEYAPEVFSPGSRDPYMLFEHYVKPGWIDKVPAICHLDGSARLQTVSNNDNPVVYHLLKKYHELSGIPLLCNTSANLNGSGFFPDLLSAMEWNKANLVWNDNKLYVKKSFAHTIESNFALNGSSLRNMGQTVA